MVRSPGWLAPFYFLGFQYPTASRNLFPLLVKIGPDSIRTTAVYSRYMRKHNREPEVMQFDAGARGGWIGPSDAKKVLLYMHGGAYVSSCHPMHVAILADLVTALLDKTSDFAVFLLEYGLVPRATYPDQLIQAATALKYLIDAKDLHPEDIFIAGDSAGGNLAIALIFHILHPHSAVPKITLAQGKKLGGAFLVSPWVTFNSDSISMKRNRDKDFPDADMLHDSAMLFQGDASIDNYIDPLNAQPDWWRDLIIHDICVVAGEYEIFRDDILK
ncbi:Alpha/Beta hydrolase protein [Aspergillus californicus]